MLNNPHAKMRSFFYFRDPTSVQICGSGGDEEKNSGAESKDNTSIFAPESAHAKALQDSLKDSIRAIQSNDHKVVDGYRTLEELGKTMYAQLKEAIDGYVHEQSLASVAAAVTNGTAVQKPTPLSSRDETELQVSNRNSAVGKSLRHAYAKNQNLFSRVEDYCGAESDNIPLVIVGALVLERVPLANLSRAAPQLRTTVAVTPHTGSQGQNPTVSEVTRPCTYCATHSNNLSRSWHQMLGSNRRDQ